MMPLHVGKSKVDPGGKGGEGLQNPDKFYPVNC